MDNALDAHAKPPAEIRAIYKNFHKASVSSLHDNPDLVQFRESDGSVDGKIKLKRCLDLPAEIRQAMIDFIGSPQHMEEPYRAIYEVTEVPGKMKLAYHTLSGANI